MARITELKWPGKHDSGSSIQAPPIGTRAEIVRELAGLNTAPEREGEDVLHGPGITIELPPSEPVTQMLMNIVEEEIGWQVITRLAKALDWKIMDTATGRELNA